MIESYSRSFPRSFLVKFSFRITLRTWPSIVVIIGQSPACVSGDTHVRPLIYFIFYCTIMFLCSSLLCTGLHSVAVEDYCLVLSLGIPAVWLGSLLVLSLQRPGHLAAAI